MSQHPCFFTNLHTNINLTLRTNDQLPTIRFFATNLRLCFFTGRPRTWGFNKRIPRCSGWEYLAEFVGIPIGLLVLPGAFLEVSWTSLIVECMNKCGMEGIGIYSDVRLVCSGALISGTRILLINIFPTDFQSKSISSWWFEPDYFDKYAAHQFATFPQDRGEHEQIFETTT